MKPIIYLLLLLIAPACRPTQSGESNDSGESVESGETSESGGPTSLFSTEVTEEELNRKLRNRSLQDQEGMRFTVPPFERQSLSGIRDYAKEQDQYGTFNLQKSVGKVFTYEGMKPVPESSRDEMMAVVKNGGVNYTNYLNYSADRIERFDFGYLEGII